MLAEYKCTPSHINRTAGFLPDLVPAGNRGGEVFVEGYCKSCKKKIE